MNTLPIKAYYLPILGKYRPYLEVCLSNPKAKTVSNRSLGLLDSGADQTQIPYSLGIELKLDYPTDTEVIKNAGGIGGTISYITRKCNVSFVDRKRNKLYTVEEQILWTYPDKVTQTKLAGMVGQHSQLTELEKQCIAGSDLEKYFITQKKALATEYKSILDRYETSLLLGRPFFYNFEFLQFFYRNPNREDTCFFVYKINPKKIIGELDL